MKNNDMHMPDNFIYEEIDQDIERHRNTIEKILNERVSRDDYSLTSLANRALELAGRLILKGEAGSDECGQALGIAAHAESYSLELANYPQGSKEIDVLIPPRADSFLRTSVGPNSTAHASRWLHAFYLTLIWWQPTLIDHVLMTIKPETLNASSTKSPAYRYLEVDAAKALWQQHPDAAEKILAAMEAMDQVSAIDKEFVAYIAMHECGMMSMIALHDEEGFNREVELALESHVKFYKQGETRRNAPEAWLCLPALGLSALAIKRGMNVHVRSAYLPLELLSP